MYGLLSSSTRPIVSIVTVAELQVLAREFSWGVKKRLDLENLLSYFDVIPIPFAGIIDAYVEVSDFSRRAGRAMGKNDIWIAATTIETGATLLTTDKDFDHLDPALLTRHWIDPVL